MSTQSNRLAKLRPETLEDAIALDLKTGAKIKPASFNQWSDRNRVTPGLRSQWLAPGGVGLDWFAHNIIKARHQFFAYDEQTIIERTVAFMTEYDTRAKFDKYVSARLKEQAAESMYRKAAKTTLKAQDVECLTDHALAVMSRAELERETSDFLKNPNSYFGKLLDVEACRVDLFTLPKDKQITVVKAMNAQAHRSPAKPAVRSMAPREKPVLAKAKLITVKVRKATAAEAFARNQQRNANPTSPSNHSTPKPAEAMKTTKKGTGTKRKSGGVSSSIRKLVKRVKGEKVTPKKKKETFLQKMKRAEKIHKASATGKFKQVPVYAVSMAKAKRQVLAGK